jgi:hypothetical protein
MVRDAPNLPHEGCGSAHHDPDRGGDFSPLMAMAVVFGFIHRENKDEARNHAEPAESGLAFVPRSTEVVSYLVATIPRVENDRSFRPGLRCGVRSGCARGRRRPGTGTWAHVTVAGKEFAWEEGWLTAWGPRHNGTPTDQARRRFNGLRRRRKQMGRDRD